MKPIFKIGDKVTFYSTKGIISDVKQINETTFEYTINNEYKTIQETDWDEHDWNDYITDKPYHKSYNIYLHASEKIRENLNVMRDKSNVILYK